MSVLYCSPHCRNRDQAEHKWSCFLHPAWECKEAESQRAIIAVGKGQEIDALAEVIAEQVGLPYYGISQGVRAPPGMAVATQNLQQVEDDGQGQEQLPSRGVVAVEQDAQEGAPVEGEAPE